MTSHTLYQYNWPVVHARKAIMIAHGLGEHGGRYEHVARWFNQHGFAVRIYDHYGHGNSPGARGSLLHANMLLDDLRTQYNAFEAELGFKPLLLGHSMGGLVAAAAVTGKWVQPSGLILSSPALRTWLGKPLHALAWALAHTVPRMPMRRKFPNHKLSHDPAVGQAFLLDPLRHARMTPRLAHFLLGTGNRVLTEVHDLVVPTLLLVAGDDELVDPAGSREFAAAAPPGMVTLHEFPALYHELFNEPEPYRQEVLAALLTWLTTLPAMEPGSEPGSIQR